MAAHLLEGPRLTWLPDLGEPPYPFRILDTLAKNGRATERREAETANRVHVVHSFDGLEAITDDAIGTQATDQAGLLKISKKSLKSRIAKTLFRKPSNIEEAHE